MKIKKPVVGDIVIYEEQPSVVYSVDESDSAVIELIQMRVALELLPVIKFYQSGYSVQPKFCENIKYPKWKYPEQTDEMIEVSDV